MAHLEPRDAAVISQVYYGARLTVPSSYISQEQICLRDYHDTPLGTIALPKPPLDAQIESILYEAGLPSIGWVPGREVWGPYHRSGMFYAILETARQMVQESRQAEISLAALRARVGIKERTFTLHLRSLIEDSQGLIELNRETVRLATWQEAMQASASLIQSMQKRFDGTIVQPQCRLGLTESYTLCDWMLTARSDGAFSLSQLIQPYAKISSGDAATLDWYIKEHMLPNGWAATYGEERTKGELSEPEGHSDALSLGS